MSMNTCTLHTCTHRHTCACKCPCMLRVDRCACMLRRTHTHTHTRMVVCAQTRAEMWRGTLLLIMRVYTATTQACYKHAHVHTDNLDAHTHSQTFTNFCVHLLHRCTGTSCHNTWHSPTCAGVRSRARTGRVCPKEKGLFLGLKSAVHSQASQRSCHCSTAPFGSPLSVGSRSNSVAQPLRRPGAALACASSYC